MTIDKRRAELWRKYRITPAQFAAKLAAQDGKCAICRTASHGALNWAIDHDHACCPRGKRACGHCNRGVLCLSCNARVVPVAESPLLGAAVAYLDRHRKILAAKKQVLAPLRV